MFRIAIGLTAFVSLAVAAAPPAGQLDPSFGYDLLIKGGGTVFTSFDVGGTKRDEGRAMVRTRNGGILMAGIVPTGTGQCLAMTRHTSEGLPDESSWLGDNHVTCLHGLLDAVAGAPYQLYLDVDLAVAPTGDIYVAGSVELTEEGRSDTYLCHIREDGSLPPGQQAQHCIMLNAQEPSDVSSEGANEPTVLLRDQEVLVVTNPAGKKRPELFRLSRETLDVVSQGPIVGEDVDSKSAFAWDADLASNGGLIIAGEAVGASYIDADYFVARYDLDSDSPVLSFSDDGFRRIAFDKAGGKNDNAYAVRALPSGDVLVAGRVEIAGSRYALGIVRLGEDGSKSEFFNDGQNLLRFENYSAKFEPWAIDETPSGRIVVSGMLDFPGAVVGSFAVRMLANGSPDMDFQNGEAALYDLQPGKFEAAYGMLLQGERIVLGGTAERANRDFMLFRISDGRLFNDGFESAP